MSRVLVCYSTQSGTSESLAERFVNGFNEKTTIENLCICSNISNFDNETSIIELEKKFDIVIFFISSYGEGEPCDDSVKFFQTLKDKRTKLSTYSIFGCGNSYYDKYQEAAIELKKILDECGCQQIGQFGQSNEAYNSVLDDYDAWEFDYVPVLGKFLNVEIKEVSEYIPMYQIIETVGGSVGGTNRNNLIDRPPYQELKPFATEIDMASVIRYGANYVHFNINLHKEKSRLKYQSGDHVGIFPKNRDGDVESILEITGVEGNGNSFKVLPMNRMESNRWIGKVYNSYKEFFLHWVEINGVLSRKMIKDIIRYFIFETSVEVRGKLNELIKSKEVFKMHVLDQRMTIVKLFQELGIKRGIHYEKIPISFILEFFGPLKSRKFSISSSDLVEPNQVGVMMKIVKEEGLCFEGVCSKTIEDIIEKNDDNKISIYINKSKFKLPMNLSKPIVLVGAGSGIAPFRGFLQDICSQSYKLNQVNKIVLYFGLRTLSEDHYIYQESFAKFKRVLGDKLEIRLALSGGDESSKRYVQDLIREDCQSIVELLVKEKGHIYICGDAGGMSRGVKKVLVDIIGEYEGGDVKKGDQYVQYMQSLGRYREDVW